MGSVGTDMICSKDWPGPQLVVRPPKPRPRAGVADGDMRGKTGMVVGVRCDWKPGVLHSCLTVSGVTAPATGGSGQGPLIVLCTIMRGWLDKLIDICGS
jgi:hypothetical protein